MVCIWKQYRSRELVVISVLYLEVLCTTLCAVCAPCRTVAAASVWAGRQSGVIAAACMRINPIKASSWVMLHAWGRTPPCHMAGCICVVKPPQWVPFSALGVRKE